MTCGYVISELDDPAGPAVPPLECRRRCGSLRRFALARRMLGRARDAGTPDALFTAHESYGVTVDCAATCGAATSRMCLRWPVATG